jgi:hypothetical protein
MATRGIGDLFSCDSVYNPHSSPLAPLWEKQAVKTDARCAGSRLPPQSTTCTRSTAGRRASKGLYGMSQRRLADVLALFLQARLATAATLGMGADDSPGDLYRRRSIAWSEDSR